MSNETHSACAVASHGDAAITCTPLPTTRELGERGTRINRAVRRRVPVDSEGNQILDGMPGSGA